MNGSLKCPNFKNDIRTSFGKSFDKNFSVEIIDIHVENISLENLKGALILLNCNF